MSYRLKEVLRTIGFLGCIFLAFGVLLFLIIFLSTSATNNNYYEWHRTEALSASAWSSGTFEDAKQVVTKILFEATIPGSVHITLSDTLRYWNTEEGRGFDGTDIVIDSVYMYLSKKDYILYRKWLLDISKPYVKGEKFLTPPYLPSPWQE